MERRGVFVCLFVCFEGGQRVRVRIFRGLHTQQHTPSAGLSLNPEITTGAKIKSHLLTRLNYPGTPERRVYMYNLI